MSDRRTALDLIGASLTWKRVRSGWRLFDGKRRFGDVVPDSNIAGIWRCVLSGGRLSDLANLPWARNAVMEAAVRELLFEARHDAATDPLKCPVNGGVFGSRTPPIRENDSGDTQCHDWPAADTEVSS